MIYCQFLASLWLTSCNTYISTCNNLYVILSFWTNLLQAKNRWHQWWLLHENFASICHVLPLKSWVFSSFWSRKHSGGPRNLVDDSNAMKWGVGSKLTISWRRESDATSIGVDLGQIRGYLGVLATSTFATPDGFELIYGNFWYNEIILILNFEKCKFSFLDLKLAVSAPAFSC